MGAAAISAGEATAFGEIASLEWMEAFRGGADEHFAKAS